MKERKPEELWFVFQLMTNRNLIVLHPLDKKTHQNDQCKYLPWEVSKIRLKCILNKYERERETMKRGDWLVIAI